MARTAINGGVEAVDATNAVDTAGYGKVTIIATSKAAGGSVAVQVGDTATVDTTPVSTLIDPNTGEPAVLTGLASGDRVVASYIGEKQYIKAVGTNADVVLLLSEGRRTTPQ